MNVLNELADLEAQVASVRPEIPEDFETLCRSLEGARDGVRDFLGTLPEPER